MKNKIPSVLNPFDKAIATGKNNMLLPDIDCAAFAIVYKKKTYGGYVKINIHNELNINRVFDFLVKSGKNTIKKLKEKKCLD